MSKFTDSFNPYKLDLFKNGVRLPEVNISKEEKLAVGLQETASNLEYLKKLAWIGVLDKIKKIFNSYELKIKTTKGKNYGKMLTI